MSRRVVHYVWFVALAAATLAALVVFEFPVQLTGVGPWAGVVALIALTVLGEGLGARIATGGAILSVALIPTVATVPLFGPTVAVCSTIVSQFFAQVLILNRPRIKAVFNISQFVLAVGLGSIVYVALGGPTEYWKAAISGSEVNFELLPMLPPLAGLIVTYFLANIVLVSIVLSLDTGKRLPQIWRQLGPVAFANDLASSSFSLFVIFAFAELGVLGLFVVLLPLFFVQHSYGIQHKLTKQNKEILEFTIRTIEAKDPYTSGHSLRVASLSRQLAEALGLSDDKVAEVETAALLHDIGKIDIAYTELISSPAKLSEVEREIIRSHPERGARLLASLSSMSKTVLSAIRHHHEHYDGNGYPDGLIGEEIPVAARIIMVVDTVDAMLSSRPYRAALSSDDVVAELRRFSGRQFDPAIAAKFIELGMVRRAAQRAEADRTPLPVVRPIPVARVSVS